MCFNPGHPCECLTSDSRCEPCKMTAKDNEMEDGADPASSIGEPQTEVSAEAVGEPGRNWGWMLSGVICLNILMLGCSLVSSTTSSSVNIRTPDLQIFIIILFLLTCIWMIYYTIHTTKTEHAVIYKDEHAGPIWLRGGLVLFGLLSIIMDIFKIASYVGYLHCDSAVKVAFPVVQLIFILVQTYFLWIHSKDCVQLQKNLSRCGMMLILSTNLVLWMAEVTEESLHQTTIPKYQSNITKLSRRSMYINKAGYGDDHCKCSHTSCSFFKQAYYYLYPFNIEYSLFASAMAYVMWKNVGRVTHESSHHVQFSLREVYTGPTFGILTVAAGLATFIIYEIEMNTNDQDEESKARAVMMYFIMNIVIVSLMSICTIIGSAIFKVDHREHVKEKNPTRSLDVGLLVGSSLGQFIISYFSIVAMVATGAKGYLNGLNLAWGILMVIQLGLQNFFIVEGLHRQPFHDVEPDTVVSNPYVTEPGTDVSKPEKADTVVSNPYVTAPGTDVSKPEKADTVVSNPYVTEPGTDVSKPEKADTEKSPIPDTEAQNHSGTTEHKHKLLWKRRVLREVSAFLLLCNVILWIMPAFGARPQFDHDAETQFYQFSSWAIIVNVGLPFGIFYRMHSVGSLFEVFLNS